MGFKFGCCHPSCQLPDSLRGRLGSRGRQACVLVCFGCCNKILETKRFIITEIYFSQFWKLEVSGCPQDQVRVLFWLQISHCVLKWLMG